MPYTRSQFCGSSVRSIFTSLGLGVGQLSQLRVSLVDDPANGDSFVEPTVGTPGYFEFGSLSFAGLIQRWTRRRDTSEFPGYEVTLVDPREVLECATVITAAYSGSVSSMPNLINVYGYWENTTFGGSQLNDTGMPWPKVQAAIQALCNSPAQGTYGGPLLYKGYAYGVDLSELPTVSVDYRVGAGVGIGLLELVAQVCEDGGCDFFVELVGQTITIRTISRVNQPPLGTLSAYIDTNWGNVVSAEYGLEARNETTSAFLVGGETSLLYMTTDIQQFWGYSFDGYPITGDTGYYLWAATPIDEENPPNNRPPPLLSKLPPDYDDPDWEYALVNNDTYEKMAVNASAVADILGSVSYATNTLELRLAKAGLEPWMAYMAMYNPGIAALIGINSPFKNMGGAGVFIKADMVNDEAVMNLLGDIHQKESRFYEFIRGVADEFWGRQYLVGLPFLLYKQDPESLEVTTSYEVTDSAYLPEGSDPLGLSPLNEDQFRSPDGKMRCFVRYDDISAADLSQLPNNGSILENATLYVEGRPSQQIMLNPTPVIVLELPAPIMEEAVDGVGNSEIIGALLQKSHEDAEPIFTLFQFGTTGLRLAPPAIHPSAIAVPLKSNTATYGPWTATGAYGKVKFEYDPSLVPWQYGGHTNMALAGAARVGSSLTNTQEIETGSITLVGVPLVSLGRALSNSGPQVTDMSVKFGPDGVTTTYSFATYTQRYGVLGKSISDRIRKVGATAQEVRRNLRAAINENNAKAGVLAAAGNTARAAGSWMRSATKAVKGQSPVDTFIGFNLPDASTGTVRVGVAACTAEEAASFTNLSNSTNYARASAMSLAGLIRGFSTNSTHSGSMPVYAGSTAVTGAVPRLGTLDPWKAQNDIEMWAWGSGYTGLHAHRRAGTTTNARPIALRGPLVVAGWGYDTEGGFVPSAGEYMKNSNSWKAGPVDLLWDSRRGVWTSHDLYKGTTATAITANGSGTVTITPLSGSTWTATAYNWFGTEVPINTKVICGYVATDNRLYITAADCV